MNSKISNSEASGRVLARLNLPRRYFALLTTVFIATLILLYMAVGFNGDGEASPGLGTIETKRPTPDVLVKDTGPASLYSPHHINKLNDKWFIVDGWHHRVIWSYDLEAPIEEWGVVDNDLAGPHTIDYMHPYYVVDDTKRNAVNFYTFENGWFKNKYTLNNLGKRTHRVKYDSVSDALYVLASESQEMFKIKLDDKSAPMVTNRYSLNFLEGAYTRSFTILDDSRMLFVSGPGYVVEATYRKGDFSIINKYRVPREFMSMNDIIYDGRNFILTATYFPYGAVHHRGKVESLVFPKQVGSIGFVESLSEISEVADQYARLGMKGRPYNMSIIDGKIYLTEAAEYSRILEIGVGDKGLEVIRSIHSFGKPEQESINIKNKHEKERKKQTTVQSFHKYPIQSPKLTDIWRQVVYEY